MSDIMAPTAEDLARDLKADLAYLAEVETIEPGGWHVAHNVHVSQRAFAGWPAAIRRARAAERERDKLHAGLSALIDAVMREDAADAVGVSEELWAAVKEATAVLSPTKEG